ncbi:DUF397 domain-containing protein [Amycolatopsis sp. H20-H5]|uniref:DUF397 domain-containing protein n=1 Tax=Amycolatopsis sp. H20-H5 TaxID=3046309 RepID=UPI002DB8A703|nr:DUF397 domain-containing protein [Amycolatopsis sp. H20-H5]MEC3976933.1 DUF397 domain-containing protein [Amycolatopsis sp. H20-H5]
MTTSREPGTWFKSSRSPDKADCVEVRLGRVVEVRDTKDRLGGSIGLSSAAWDALLDNVKC